MLNQHPWIPGVIKILVNENVLTFVPGNQIFCNFIVVNVFIFRFCIIN